MTEREKEILSWIKENPMISQQEIANRAHITRSSVAVHISNLIKKGEILGRGYVLQEESFVTVIGAVNVDIIATSDSILIDDDSNPGKVDISYGGAGRNIAENISRLGVKVELITVLGDDVHAQEIEKNCRTLGIGLKHTMVIPGENTSTYICINDKEENRKLAISDMEIYSKITPEYLSTKLEIINRSSLILIDANLSEKAIDFLCENCCVPIFVDAVSTKKAVKLKNIFSSIYSINLNRMEAEILSGIKIINYDDLKKCSDILIKYGIKNVFISLGKDGVYYANYEENKKMPYYSSNIINNIGCGNAFISGIAFGYINGYSIERMTKAGLAATALCTEVKGAINGRISVENINNIIKD
ncbi:PfkB family carbohydrate kinase [Clostridium botulinum]|uniref:Carbohydrate kinase n=1 Tax=Clostridium botulinum TaxID=1491 RepID=A0A9Q1ZBQ3_CLOBO|nr:PfkB family carbohydrate kinase [Clostridium botulinum]AEB75141.1 PfkB domain protein [Clostridium botulinum BKT015925]KEI01885.1 carbohydrate kinase [Clostridium botulinum D str. 16868]KEI05604.1 carbohydrate kinase [Clostridium botulinum C/D str. Sp77]KLU75062.1 carbohydrate kinase [Clostridium botulinum V891]KOA77189.1 carbohydrate kinase [Clostridium botulinum]